MAQNFDVIVIGVGMAGQIIARKIRAAGREVAVVDSRPYGGTCALRGCDPKKVLVGAAQLLDWQQRMAGHGVAGDAQINWSDLMQFKHTFTEPVPESVENSLKNAGIATYHGTAHFTGPNTIQVEDKTLTASQIVITTGAKPVPLGIPGSDLLATSTDFLDLDELPERIVFVGGGYISFEFAHVAARAGAAVTIVHRGKRPLVAFDSHLVNELLAASRAIGIDVRLEAEVQAIERNDDSYQVHTSGGSTIEADLVVHGAGRVPEIDALNPEEGNVDYTRHGIVVNEYLQSVSNPAVYAAGDCVATKGMELTPIAVSEAHIVAKNMLEGNKHQPDYTGTPSVVFTVPPLARVGLSEEEAREKGLKYKVNHHNTSDWFSARHTNEAHAAFKVLLEEDNGRILGAHVLGSHAGDVINLFAVAFRQKLTAKDIKETIFAYPTESADIQYMV